MDGGRNPPKLTLTLWCLTRLVGNCQLLHVPVYAGGIRQ